jgi:hypothetical protein
MLIPQISWLTTPNEAVSEGYDIAVEIAPPAPVLDMTVLAGLQTLLWVA